MIKGRVLIERITRKWKADNPERCFKIKELIDVLNSKEFNKTPEKNLITCEVIYNIRAKDSNPMLHWALIFAAYLDIDIDEIEVNHRSYGNSEHLRNPDIYAKKRRRTAANKFDTLTFNELAFSFLTNKNRGVYG